MAGTIYINGRFLTQPNTGVQRYAYEIIKHFDILLDESEFSHSICIRCLIPPGTPTSKVSWKNIAMDAVGTNCGNLWEQFDLPLYLKGRFLFSPANTGPLLHQNQAVTFHDASVFAVPKAYSLFFRLKYKLIFMSLSRLARVVFTDSKFSQTELARYLNLPIKKFIVIHLAGDHIKYIHPDPMILKRYGLMKGMYYLIVGSQSLHKNFLTVRNAIKLVKSDIKFVFAGGQFDKVFTKGIIQDERHNIITTGYVTDEELKALYTNALGHIFPSQYEGFGLPLLEAMHCGCPVLCSQAASLPEIAGDAALYFDPANHQDIATAIETMYADKQLRDGFIQKGYQCAGNFNWQATARNTLRVLLTTVGANK